MIIYPIALWSLLIVFLALIYFFWYDTIKSDFIASLRQNLTQNSFKTKLLNFITKGKDRSSLKRLFALLFAFMFVLNFIGTLFSDPKMLISEATANPLAALIIICFFVWLWIEFNKTPNSTID